MAEKCFVQTDLDFVRDVVSHGGESLKKCYQCATCSVVCPISPELGPFPRKEMIWAQWGLKNNIFSRPDIWLCHQCNDCSVYCPRGAKPGNVLASLRSLFIRHYSYPRALYDMMHERNRLGQAIAIPVLILAFTIIMLGTAGMLNQHPGAVVTYANMMPHLALNTLYTGLVFLVFLVFAMAAFRFWTNMARTAGLSCVLDVNSLKKSLWPAISEILTHSKFSECGTSKKRSVSHLLVLYGFIGLLITTTAAVFYIVFFDYYPLAQTNFFKILGNVSAAALIIGVSLMIYDRIAGPKRDKIGIGSRFDWMLIVILATVGVTGVFCEVFREAERAWFAYPMYFIHLVAVFMLLIYSPYSKLAHVVYRTEAIIFSKYAEFEREKGVKTCAA